MCIFVGVLASCFIARSAKSPLPPCRCSSTIAPPLQSSCLLAAREAPRVLCLPLSSGLRSGLPALPKGHFSPPSISNIFLAHGSAGFYTTPCRRCSFSACAATAGVAQDCYATGTSSSLPQAPPRAVVLPGLLSTLYWCLSPGLCAEALPVVVAAGRSSSPSRLLSCAVTCGPGILRLLRRAP